MLLLKYTVGKAVKMYSGLVGVCYNPCLVSKMLQVVGQGSGVQMQPYYITSLKIPCCPKMLG